MKVKDTFAFWLIGVGVLFLIITATFFLWNELTSFSSSLKIDDSKFGSFGSLLSGLVGTLWALAGVILFYVALTEQRRDIQTNRESFLLQTEALRLQIKEFEAQTKELEQTRKVYSEQSATQSSQRFENTFFQLLTLHHNIVNSMSLRNSKEEVDTTGRDCFRTFNIKFKHIWNPIKIESEAKVVTVYMQIFDDNVDTLGHYFRNLYHIFKFVDKSDVTDKKFYAGLVRAQLSSFELLFLVYNCLSENGLEKFKPLVEKYAVLKNLDLTLVGGGKATIKLYKSSAYGKKNFNFLNTKKDWF
jgi:Putative phage abortive infection protein